MGKTITIGKDTFTYENNGRFIRITGYSHEDGILIFVDEDDGRSHFHIHIPETIEGLPVLIVDKLWLNVDYKHHYRHNGRDIVDIDIPENAAFLGLKHVRIDMYSVFVPNHSASYYPRENKLLKTDEGAYHIFGKPIDDNTCQIIEINCDKYYEKKWVWAKENLDLSLQEKLVVPSKIEGYDVKEICADGTYALPQQVKEVRIGEGIETIGDDCFSGLPFMADVYLPKSLKHIGAKAFSFYKKDEFIPDVPTLKVHYYDAMPAVGEGAFIRQADRNEYEEYADWGEMYAGTTHFDYEVVYEKIQ